NDARSRLAQRQLGRERDRGRRGGQKGSSRCSDHRCCATQAAIARVSSSVNPFAIRPITVDGRSPARNACIAATISAGFCPRSGGTLVSAEAVGGWQPEHEVAPGGSAAVAAVAIPSTSGNTLTRLTTLSP